LVFGCFAPNPTTIVGLRVCLFLAFFAATKKTIISGNSNAALCKLAIIVFYKKLNAGHPISQHGTTSIPNEKSYEIDENSCMNLMNLRTYMLIAKKDFVSHINHKI
jgi:hypothetical protein